MNNWLDGSTTPKKIWHLLVRKVRKEEIEGPAPGLIKIQVHAQSRSRKLATSIALRSVADINEFTGKRTLLAQMEAIKCGEGDENALVVLPGGDMKKSDGSDGIVMSSVKMLQNLKFAGEAWGWPSVPGSCDGTYKIHVGNWVLIVFGTPSLRDTDKVTTTLRPFSLALVPVESEETYSKLFRCTVEAGKLLFKETLIIVAMVSDHSSPAQNANGAVFPGSLSVLCWPHISRELRTKKAVLLKDKALLPFVRSAFWSLHLCRSGPMFDRLGQVLVLVLSALGEKVFVKWMVEQYLQPPWNCWYVTASKIMGLLPNNNFMESANRGIKVVLDKRFSFDSLFFTHIPNLLVAIGADKTGPIVIKLPYYLSEHVHHAFDLVNGGGVVIKFKPGTKRAGETKANFLCGFVHSSQGGASMVVTSDRVHEYESALKGEFALDESEYTTVSNFEALIPEVQGLHKVECVADGDYFTVIPFSFNVL